MSDERDIGIRMARPDDAASIADIYVESWRETYAGLLPSSALARMSKTDQERSWRGLIEQVSLRSPVFVAADAASTLYGFASAGPSRDRSLPFDAEIYTLYAAPGFTSQGIGSALMTSVFRLFSKATYKSMIIWSLADNPSRFFYEAMGGRRVAERLHPVWGESYREIAYGWDGFDLKAVAGRSSSSLESGGPN